MAFGYEVHPSTGKKAGAPTPFHHPPRPVVERSRTAPVSVPSNHAAVSTVPPPLPPPRNVEVDEHDLGWHMANRQGRRRPSETSTLIRAGSSLLGGGQHTRPGKTFTVPERSVDIAQRQAPPRLPTTQSVPDKLSSSLFSSLKQGTKDEMVPASPPFPDLRRLMEYNKLQSEKHMSSDSLRRSSQAYDQQLLSKIGSPSGQQGSAGALEETSASMENRLNRLNGQLLSLSESSAIPGLMDQGLSQENESVAEKWKLLTRVYVKDAGTPPAPAPGFPALASPLSDAGLDHHRLPSFPHRPSLRKNSFSDPNQGGRFHPSGMAELSLKDRSPTADYQSAKTGQKRRAQSPPTDHLNARPSANSQLPSQWERNVMQLAGNRNPQAPKLESNATPGSLSSVASSGPLASYSSTFSLSQASTAATSYTSEFQPGAYQPAALGVSQQSQGQIPQLQYSAVGPPAQPINNMAPPPPPTSRKAGIGVLRAPGLWICDCCPKKPRRFDTEEALRIHEMEKQYICQYCHNRFKNKNEAERHQNSLHLRRNSWSCSALTSFEAAFHSTPINTLAAQIPGQTNNANASQQFQGLHSTATDSCGYCGQEFINPPNWEDRVNHLNAIHKFGECNQSKKFFRADHFRQHLKHSHAGTSGKWTNMLEQACMKDEPPPQPVGPGMPPVPNALPTGIPGIAMIGQQALLAQQQMVRQAQQQQHQQQQQVPQATQASPPDPLPSPYSQFPGLQALQNYQPPVQQQSFAPTTSPTPQQQAQQAQSLAQHLQQAQREMSAMSAGSVQASESLGDGAGQHVLGQASAGQTQQ